MSEQPSPLDIMFKDAEEEPLENKEVITEEQEEEEIPEEIEEEETEEKEDDYDSELPEKKDEEPEEETFANDTQAVKRAKEEGKRRKELEVTLKEKELELERIREELEGEKTKRTELEAVKIKPEEHPEFIELQQRILKGAKRGTNKIDAPNKDVVYNKLGTHIREFRKIEVSEDPDKALEDFKKSLAAQLFGEGSTFDDLEKDDRKEVLKAIDVIEDATEKAAALDKLGKDLEKQAKTGTLAVGVREYEALTKEFQPILDNIGDLPEDVIETNPYSIESKVAMLAKTPEGKKRVDAAKRDVVDLLFGLRPLSQQEIEKMEANGTDIKSYQADRQKLLNEKRKKLLPLLVQGLASRADVKKAFAELAELRGKKESEESEDDALGRIRKKKAAPVEKKVKSPVDIMFEGT